MNNFSKTMLEIKEHYSNSTTPYKFKTPIQPSNDPLPDDALAAQNYFHLENTGFSNHQENAISNNSETYTETKNYADFKSRMEKNRDEAKERANAFIDEYTNKMVESGTQHPEIQDNILDTFEKTLKFFSNEVMKKIADFATKVIDNIVKWVTEVFQKIKDTFFDVVNIIENFFN